MKLNLFTLKVEIGTTDNILGVVSEYGILPEPLVEFCLDRTAEDVQDTASTSFLIM